MATRRPEQPTPHPTYKIDEKQLDVALTVTNLDGTALPSPIDVKVTRTGGPTFEQNMSNGNSKTIWLPAGSYTVSAALPSGASSAEQDAYPAVSHTATPGNAGTGAITLAQAPAALTVSYTNADHVTVTATCTGGQTLPANCARRHPEDRHRVGRELQQPLGRHLVGVGDRHVGQPAGHHHAGDEDDHAQGRRPDSTHPDLPVVRGGTGVS